MRTLRLGIRARLFVVTFVLIVAVDVSLGLHLERQLRVARDEVLVAELSHQARAVRELVEAANPPPTTATADPLIDRLGGGLGSRVTVVDEHGRVIADSAVALEGLSRLENHADRPEIEQATEGRIGHARRFSATTGEELIYVAVQWNGGVVRVARPARDVDDGVTRLRGVLAIAGLVSIAAAAAISGVAAQLLGRSLRSLVRTANRITTHPREPIVFSEDELGRLAAPLNRLARDLERTVATLAEERDRFETVLESMGEAVIALDSERRIITINRSAIAMLGLPQDVHGRPLLEVVRLPQLADLVARTDASGRATTAELDLHAPRPMRILARGTPRANGGPVVVLHDISEIRRLEAVRRDFVANVSHELRTPVSIIRANAETLMTGALEQPDQARRFVDALMRASDRLGRLISDLLDISRIEAGKYTLEPLPIEVVVVARRALESVEARGKQKNMRTEMSIPAGVAVRADAKALEQVLVNLLENAVKYTPAGGHVEVRLGDATDDLVRIEVVDDGPGIEPIHRPRVFERFYRVDPGRSRDMGGTGLGLAIVKNLVEMMGGRVGVGPRLPHGSVFWVQLPVAERT